MYLHFITIFFYIPQPLALLHVTTSSSVVSIRLSAGEEAGEKLVLVDFPMVC